MRFLNSLILCLPFSLDFDTLSTTERFSTYQLTVMPMEAEPNSEQVSSCNMCRKGISITQRGW